jgi:hypothetical protein
MSMATLPAMLLMVFGVPQIQAPPPHSRPFVVAS